MPTTAYRPITGADFRVLAKAKLNEFVDRIPHGRANIAFHQFCMTVKISVTAYPSDAATPNGEAEIDLKSPDLAQYEQAFELYKNDLQLTEDLLNRIAEELDAKKLIIEETMVLDDRGSPDALRVENGLPIMEVYRTGMNRVHQAPRR